MIDEIEHTAWNDRTYWIMASISISYITYSVLVGDSLANHVAKPSSFES